MGTLGSFLINHREIVAIYKPDRYSQEDAIQYIKDNFGIVYTLQEAVAWAEDPANQFYVARAFSSRVRVEVMPPRYVLGSKYLRTVPDRIPGNNLLSLPEIPYREIANRSCL